MTTDLFLAGVYHIVPHCAQVDPHKPKLHTRASLAVDTRDRQRQAIDEQQTKLKFKAKPWMHVNEDPRYYRRLREFDIRNEVWIRKRELRQERLVGINQNKLTSRMASFKAQEVGQGIPEMSVMLPKQTKTSLMRKNIKRDLDHILENRVGNMAGSGFGEFVSHSLDT